MWNKYANNDKGFCIGYNSRILFEYLGGGGQVKYFDKSPVILPKPIMTNIEHIMFRLFSKEKKWCFEKEYRTHKFWFNPAEMKDRQITLPKEAFNCVILGNEVSRKNRIEIINEVENNIGTIPIIERKNVC